MSFSDDMHAMNAEDVKQAVITRLRDHEGMPWNESRGEPVWGLLLSAFQHWQKDAAKLKALDSALDELARTAFEQEKWALAMDTCDFAIALVGTQPPTGGQATWLAPSTSSWPFEQWLKAPLTPPERINASIAAFRLMRLAGKASQHWINHAFKQAQQGLGTDSAITWFIECWKAIISLSPAGETRGLRIPLFEALSTASRLHRDKQDPVAEAIVSWAWLLFEPSERTGLIESILKTTGDFEDSKFLAILEKIAKQELPETPQIRKTIQIIEQSQAQRGERPMQPATALRQLPKPNSSSENPSRMTKLCVSPAW